MSYYNTQNNPQQNPAVQANSPHNQQVSRMSQPRQAGQQSFGDWMRPQRKAQGAQGGKSVTSEKINIGAQQNQNPNGQGWQPRSPVNPNGTISTQPIAFQAAYQPPTPNMSVQRTTSNQAPANPQWEQLRTQQNQAPGNVPPEFQAISQAYQQNLGRPGSLPEWQNWAKNPNYMTDIANSPEAQAFKSVQQNPQSQAPNPFAALPQYNPMEVPGYMSQSMSQYGNIQTPNMYDVFRPESYQYGGQLDEGGNPFGQGTIDAFNQLRGLPAGIPVDQMKAAQSELANEMFQQNAGQSAQRAAASGTVNGGMAELQRQKMLSDRNKQILAGHRDIDIEDAYARRDNASKLADLGDRLGTGRANRMNLDENARLNEAQEGRAADESYMDFLSGQYNDALSGSEFELNRANDVADRGQGIWDTLNDNYFKGRSSNLQEFLGREGMNLDWSQFGEEQAQNKFGNIMDLLGFGEGQRQFDATYGQNNKRINIDARDSAMRNALTRRGQDINLLDFFREG